MPRPTGQLEQEAEQARADLSATLDALRARLTPGQLLDDFMDSARDGSAGRFVQNLGRNVQENPLPVALVGLGLAWTMISTAASRRDGGFERARASTESGYFGPDTIEDGVGAGVDSLTEAAPAGSATAARATDLYRRTARAGSQAKDRITGQASEFTERVSSASRGLVDFCKEQPVVLVGLGLAIGAAIGALLPASRTEDRLFGEASKRIKEQAGDMAERAYDTGEDAVSKAVDQAASAASEALQGMGSESGLRPASSGSSAPPLQDDESTSLVPSENQGSSPDWDKTITAAGDRRDSSS
jgi:ElaB/YqjD/DUF883 family membrane-anchored ribosome-binding protein